MMASLAMGSYGAFVWGSFVLTFAVVIVTAVQSRLRHRRLLREIRSRIEVMEAEQ